MIYDLTVTAFKRSAYYFDGVRCAGDFVQLTHNGRKAATVTRLTIDDLRACRRALEAQDRAGNSDGAGALVKLRGMEGGQ